MLLVDYFFFDRSMTTKTKPQRPKKIPPNPKNKSPVSISDDGHKVATPAFLERLRNVITKQNKCQGEKENRGKGESHRKRPKLSPDRNHHLTGDFGLRCSQLERCKETRRHLQILWVIPSVLLRLIHEFPRWLLRERCLLAS